MSFPPAHLKRKREEFERDAIELLTCPICFEYLSVPTYECRKGHILCQECYKSLVRTTKICPQCRCSLEIEVLKNDFIAQMLSCFRSECSYKRNGCNIELSLHDRRAHEESCVYRVANTCSQIEEIICPFNVETCSYKKCGRKLNKDDIIKHFAESHSIKLMTYTDNRFTIPHNLGNYCIKLPLGYFYICVQYDEQFIVYIAPIWIIQKDLEGKVVRISCRYNPDIYTTIYELRKLIISKESGSNICIFRLNDLRSSDLFRNRIGFLLTIN